MDFHIDRYLFTGCIRHNYSAVSVDFGTLVRLAHSVQLLYIHIVSLFRILQPTPSPASVCADHLQHKSVTGFTRTSCKVEAHLVRHVPVLDQQEDDGGNFVWLSQSSDGNFGLDITLAVVLQASLGVARTRISGVGFAIMAVSMCEDECIHSKVSMRRLVYLQSKLEQ